MYLPEDVPFSYFTTSFTQHFNKTISSVLALLPFDSQRCYSCHLSLPGSSAEPNNPFQWDCGQWYPHTWDALQPPLPIDSALCLSSSCSLLRATQFQPSSLTAIVAHTSRPLDCFQISAESTYLQQCLGSSFQFMCFHSWRRMYVKLCSWSHWTQQALHPSMFLKLSSHFKVTQSVHIQISCPLTYLWKCSIFVLASRFFWVVQYFCFVLEGSCFIDPTELVIAHCQYPCQQGPYHQRISYPAISILGLVPYTQIP